MKCEIKGCTKKAGMSISDVWVCIDHGVKAFSPAADRWMSERQDNG
jgi:hypothetical protein